jgi:hypothetical protein
MVKSKNQNPTIIKERVINFEELKEQGFNLKASMMKQGWENYFKILDGPIYDHLVQEFWKNACMKNKASSVPEIQSMVIGHQVTITLAEIAKAIGCPEEGINIEKYKYNSCLNSNVIKKLYDFHADQNETTSLKHKISLPLTILNHMKTCIEISKTGKSCFIPYGRVISQLLIQQGIVKKARCNKITEYLDISWANNFQVNGQTNNIADCILCS